METKDELKLKITAAYDVLLGRDRGPGQRVCHRAAVSQAGPG